MRGGRRKGGESFNNPIILSTFLYYHVFVFFSLVVLCFLVLGRVEGKLYLLFIIILFIYFFHFSSVWFFVSPHEEGRGKGLGSFNKPQSTSLDYFGLILFSSLVLNVFVVVVVVFLLGVR